MFRHDGLTNPTVRGCGLALDQTKTLQLGDLPADRRVIAPDPIREIDDPDRTTTLDDLNLEEADDALGEGVVVRVGDAADRALDPAWARRSV